MQKNHIFQIQNAIYQTLKSINLDADVILTRSLSPAYPYIIILGTKKITDANLQVSCTTEIQVNTKDIFVLNIASIIEKIENIISVANVRQYLNFYTLNYIEIVQCETAVNEEGYFCGKITVKTLMD